MAEQERPQKHGSGFFRLFERGVDTATRNNVTAYGYSVSITAAFAILQTSRTDTGVIEIFIFSAGRSLRRHRMLGVGLLSGRARGPTEPRKVAGGRPIVLFGGPRAGGRVPGGDSDRRTSGVAGERLLDDDRVHSGGRGRAGRGAPDVAERRVACTKARCLCCLYSRAAEKGSSRKLRVRGSCGSSSSLLGGNLTAL
jgi:hypothetical protein